MRFKEFVQQILNEIDEITRQPESFSNPNYFVMLESKRRLFQIKKIIVRYGSSEEEINEDNIKLILNFFQDTWNKIQNTDAIYSHNLYTHANRVFCKIAELIASLIHVHPYKILMPSLVITNQNYNIRLDQIVISDDNRTIIDVFKCLYNAQMEHEPALKHTHPVTKCALLSNAEKERVINHSVYTKRYFDEIAKQRSNRAQDKAQVELRKEMPSASVLVSYGDNGQTLLASNLFQDDEQLINALMIEPLLSWPNFLKNFSLNALKKIVLDEGELRTIIQDKSNYSGRELHDRAMFVIFLELYLQQLSNRSKKFNSLMGWVSGFGVPKWAKLEAAQVVYHLLIQGIPLSEIKPNAFARIEKLNRSTKEKEIIKNALEQKDNGVLGMFVKQIELVSSEKFLEEEASDKKSVFDFLSFRN